MNIAVGIVLYNPDVKRFRECIDEILKQVDKVYVFDNSEESTNIALSDKVVYLSERKNMGIAYALNMIMDSAKKDGYDWVITMDQDSIIPVGLVDAYKEAIDRTNEIGIVCPQVVDKRRAYMEVKTTPKEEYVEFCITSASCTSVEVWEKIGKFDEWLFIDLVDNDFCKRLVLSGFRILKLNDMVLNQEFGKIIPKNELIQRFWVSVGKMLHNDNFAKLSYRKFVSPMRVYYTCRNIIYVNKKLAEYGPVAYKENYNCSSYFGFVISFIAPSILRAQDKIAVLKASIKGTHDGMIKKVGEWKIN
ncbi:MAG: glycosyltransferase family 2 protein [Floccifex sp.]